MAATIARRKPLVTAEAFLRQYGDDKGVELVQGKIVRYPMPGAKHGEVLMEAGVIFHEFIKAKKLGRVLAGDAFIRTRRTPDSYRGADVCYLSYKQWPKNREIPIGAMEIPPELVIEVKSPSDRWAKVLSKISEYLEAGVCVVIVLDPETESASIHRQDELHQLCHNGDVLTLPDVLPGFSVPVKKFFD